MIRAAGDRLEVVQPMVLANASALLAQGKSRLDAEETVFDLGKIAELDSSALAVVFGWTRAAARAGRRVRIVNAPENLLSLADLYGVAQLLPL